MHASHHELANSREGMSCSNNAATFFWTSMTSSALLSCMRNLSRSRVTDSSCIYSVRSTRGRPRLGGITSLPSTWCSVMGGHLRSNNLAGQEKTIVNNELVANLVVMQNLVDQTLALHTLKPKGSTSAQLIGPISARMPPVS